MSTAESLETAACGSLPLVLALTADSRAVAPENSQVAIFDATNSTEQRRQLLVRTRPCLAAFPIKHTLTDSSDESHALRRDENS